MFRPVTYPLDADFCVEALREALVKEKPEVFNTDQGSQFTGEGFTGHLQRHGVRISPDKCGAFGAWTGKGATPITFSWKGYGGP